MNVAEFHQQIELVWELIEQKLDEQEVNVDCEVQGAVFTMTFDDDSQIVINKQEALLELWLASKLGGFHFSYHNGEWLTIEGRSFWAHLTDAMARHGEVVDFS